MTIKEYLKNTSANKGFILIRPPVVCADGFKVSIQASHLHYCSPREDLANGEYESVEIGFPSFKEELIMRYRDGDIYPYVPIDIVEKMIANHGGIEL